MKILVTGATGVIGRRLFDASSVRRAVEGQDAVINLATHIPASSAQMALPWAWRENDRIRRDNSDRWIDENAPIRPVRYNRTVADAEAASQRFTANGRSGVVLRFGSFYGPDALQRRDLMTWVRKGWAPIPGPPGAYISSVSHNDAATAVAAAVMSPAAAVVHAAPGLGRRAAGAVGEDLESKAPQTFRVDAEVPERCRRVANSDRLTRALEAIRARPGADAP